MSVYLSCGDNLAGERNLERCVGDLEGVYVLLDPEKSTLPVIMGVGRVKYQTQVSNGEINLELTSSNTRQ